LDILVGTAGISRIEHSVQRAAHAGWATVQDVCVNLRRRHVAVPEKLLEGPDIAEQERLERRATLAMSGGPFCS
jgi:hypothetical protein